ncbi:hypothetical protein MHU86_12747 [Fragilaria crotonensis]|nr:hypothetical protein MHU86_12747 [Fragilaria crotonensis]
MSEINPETGESTSGRSPRFSIWAAFLIFSTITMISAVEEYNSHNESDANALKNQRWAIACSAITFGVSVIVVALQLHPIGASLIVGTRVEGVIILILTAFWAATVSIVSDTRNGLAVDNLTGSVTNGNLYYFSWAGFVCSVMLFVSYLRAVFGVDLASEIKNRSARLTQWSALLAAQLVVLGASANIFDSDCNPLANTVEYCQRTTFGIAAGAIGTAFSLAVVAMKIATSSASFMAEAVVAATLTVLNGFAVGFITSPAGPGSALGNLYYFSWISLIVSAMLVASCFETYRGGPSSHTPGTEMTGTNGADRRAANEFPVETLDDNI